MVLSLCYLNIVNSRAIDNAIRSFKIPMLIQILAGKENNLSIDEAPPTSPSPLSTPTRPLRIRLPSPSHRIIAITLFALLQQPREPSCTRYIELTDGRCSTRIKGIPRRRYCGAKGTCRDGKARSGSAPDSWVLGSGFCGCTRFNASGDNGGLAGPQCCWGGRNSGVEICTWRR